MQTLNQSCQIILNNSRGNSDLKYKLPSTNNNHTSIIAPNAAGTDCLKKVFFC